MSISSDTPPKGIDISNFTLAQLKELADAQVLQWASTDLAKPPLSTLNEFDQWVTLLDTFLQLRSGGSSQTSAQLASALLMLMKAKGKK